MTFSKEIIEIFDYIGEKLGIAIDWSSSNVIPYLQELCEKYIRYEIAVSIMWMVVGLMFILSYVAWIKLISYLSKKFKEDGPLSDWDIGRGFSYMGMILCIIVGVVIIFVNTNNILKCVFLPELQIYEYISYLIK